MLDLKSSTAEIIALLLPDPEPAGVAVAVAEGRSQPMATAIVRDAQGRMSVRSIQPDADFSREAAATGCFRRGKPIIDPVSRQVMGYEMEMIPPPAASMR